MIAACPQCGARYRIEPERIPAQGARLRCSRCEAIFRVNRPEARPAPQPMPVAPPPAPQPTPVAPPPSPPRPTPVAEPQPTPSPAPGGLRPEVARSASGTRGPLVLVADPDIDAGKGLVSALADAGADPVLVHDGVEAILSIQRTLPKLVVLEASLPKMFGFQVCELMKRNEQLRTIPVVLVGSITNRDRYRREASETYGADAYLERPGLAAALIGLLREVGILEPQPSPPEVHAAPAAERAQTSRVERTPARPVARVEPPAPRPAPAPPVQATPAAPAQTPEATPSDPGLAKEIARAERLARIIVSDIVLYNPERFAAAIRSGDVVEAMSAEMDEGRAHFRERIAERIRERKDFLGEELRRVARARGAS